MLWTKECAWLQGIVVEGAYGCLEWSRKSSKGRSCELRGFSSTSGAAEGAFQAVEWNVQRHQLGKFCSVHVPGVASGLFFTRPYWLVWDFPCMWGVVDGAAGWRWCWGGGGQGPEHKHPCWPLRVELFPKDSGNPWRILRSLMWSYKGSPQLLRFQGTRAAFQVLDFDPTWLCFLFAAGCHAKRALSSGNSVSSVYPFSTRLRNLQGVLRWEQLLIH